MACEPASKSNQSATGGEAVAHETRNPLKIKPANVTTDQSKTYRIYYYLKQLSFTLPGETSYVFQSG